MSVRTSGRPASRVNARAAAAAPAAPFREAAVLREVFGLDPRSLAVFRAGLGLLLLLDLGDRARSLTAHYTDAGVLPSPVVERLFVFNFHAVHGSAVWQALLFGTAALAALAVVAGYRTRAAVAVSWVLLLSLHNRNAWVLQGGDMLFRALLFWAMFLPLGARWSLDRRRDPAGSEVRSPVLSAGSVALLLQVCFLYWFSALLKTGPEWRADGTAVWLALGVERYTTPVGQFLHNYPGLLRPLTFATLALEGLGPLVLFVPWFRGPVRTALVAAFVGFHAGLALCLAIGLFPAVCIVAWLAFLPAWFWDRLPVARQVASEAPAPRGRALGRAWQVTAVACLGLVFLTNLRAAAGGRGAAVCPDGLCLVGRRLGLAQQWDMFAPSPTRLDGWYVAAGTFADGRRVEARGGGPLRWDRPASVNATYGGDRWHKFLENTYDHAELQALYARHLFADWNRTHGPGERLERVELCFMRERVKPNGGKEPAARETLIAYPDTRPKILLDLEAYEARGR